VSVNIIFFFILNCVRHMELKLILGFYSWPFVRFSFGQYYFDVIPYSREFQIEIL